jgi:hypothetical protein
MNKVKSLFYIFGIVFFPSCATTSMVTQDISLGMTKKEVISKAGKPFSKNSYKNNSGSIVDEWSYKETTWDDKGWSWDRTIINTVVIFENDEVKSFGNVGERFKTKNPMSPSLNVDQTIHHE